MGKTSRWFRNASIGTAIIATSLSANAWSTPPENSVRDTVKTATLAPAHAYLTRQLEQQWSARADQLQTDTTHRNPARIILEERVKPLRGETPERTSLAAYTQEIDSIINVVRNNIDWEYVQNRWFTGQENSPQEQTRIAQQLTQQLSANQLLTVSYAEHVPRIPEHIYNRIQGSRLESGLGSALFEAKLRIAGREYTELVPSRHDRLVSLGPWQLTEQAVSADKDATGGASLIGLALPDSLRLPERIEYVTGSDNAKAAALMHMYNAVRIVRSTTPQELALLGEYATHPQVQLGIMLGHHAPRRAQEATKRFLEEPHLTLREHADPTLNNHIKRLETYRAR